MNRQKMVVAIVLDSSSSMASTKTQTIQGFNEQVHQAKLNAADKDIKCCLVTFNGEVYEHQWLVPVEELSEANPEEYRPNGATAFRDAVGYTINKLMATTNPEDEDLTYLLCIISDGDENSSKHVNDSSLKEIITAADKRPNFNIAYMGCDKKLVMKVHQETGIPISNMAAWSNATPEATLGGYRANNFRMKKVYEGVKSGVRKTQNIYSDNFAACADYSQEMVPAAVSDVQFGASNIPNQPQVELAAKVFCAVNPVKWEAAQDTPPVQ